MNTSTRVMNKCCWFFLCKQNKNIQSQWWILLCSQLLHFHSPLIPACATDSLCSVILRESASSAASIVLSWTIRWTWTLAPLRLDPVTLAVKANCPVDSINLSPHKVVSDWTMRRVRGGVCISVFFFFCRSSEARGLDRGPQSCFTLGAY